MIEDSNNAQKGKEIQNRFIRRQLISETVTTQDTDHAYCIDSLHNIKKSIINVSKEVNVSLNFSVPTEIDTKLSAIKNILRRDNSITFFDVFEYNTLFSALNTKSVTDFVNAIITCKKLMTYIWLQF